MKISQKLPSEFETKLIEFQHFVVGLLRRNTYSLSLISNANKTVGSSDMPRNYTINFRSEKQVAMKSTGYEKLCVTVMLHITVNSNKLSTYVIPIRKKDSAKRLFFRRFNSSCQKKVHGRHRS
jgi:hypothetical protein